MNCVVVALVAMAAGLSVVSCNYGDKVSGSSFIPEIQTLNKMKTINKMKIIFFGYQSKPCFCLLVKSMTRNILYGL